MAFPGWEEMLMNPRAHHAAVRRWKAKRESASKTVRLPSCEALLELEKKWVWSLLFHAAKTCTSLARRPSPEAHVLIHNEL